MNLKDRIFKKGFDKGDCYYGDNKRHFESLINIAISETLKEVEAIVKKSGYKTTWGKQHMITEEELSKKLEKLKESVKG